MARATHFFGESENTEKTEMSRIVTIYMDIDDKNKKTLKKIYFSQKGRESNQKEMIENVIDHCYKGKQKFVSKQIHKLLSFYCARIKLTPGLEMETNCFDEEKDEKMIEYLLNDLSSITGIESLIDKDKRKLHYLIIFVIDILS